MTQPEELEPAQHDDPDGPKKGWSAKEMSDVPDATDDDIVKDTELVASGLPPEEEA